MRLAVLISGGGTTLKNLLQQIADGKLTAKVELVISSDSNAKGLEYAVQHEIRTSILESKQYPTVDDFSHAIFSECRNARIDTVAMGGFLKYVRIPDDFQNRVTNIHPSLIPAFCGKGFYGIRVHQAVLDYGAKMTGCTVHFVDNEYDHGPIILQSSVPVADDDDADSLQKRVFEKECEVYPQALQMIAEGRVEISGRRVRTR